MIESGEKILSPELIGNPTHAEWIRKNGYLTNGDDFCEHTVITVSAFSEYVDKWFRENYALSETRDMWDDEDRRYEESYSKLNLRDIIWGEFKINNDDLLSEIIENLPDIGYAEMKNGGEPFYNDCNYYELKSDQDKRNSGYDYYDIDAALSFPPLIKDLNEKLDAMKYMMDQYNFEGIIQRQYFQMIFGNCVSIYESYLSDKFINLVFNNIIVTSNFLKNREYGGKIQYQNTLCNLYEASTDKNKAEIHKNKIENKIKELLSKTTFHNVHEAKNIYKIVGIEIDLSGIECFINKRHDFVHRNGKDKDGHIVKTSKEEIINLISIIKNICDNINNQALHLNYAR